MASSARANQTATKPAKAIATTSEPGERHDSQAPEPATAASVEINCLMNARYHSAREAFLDTVHRWFMFSIVLTGATAISGLFDGVPQINVIFGAIAALLGAADLALDLSNRARTHALMKRRYFELLADMRDGYKTIEQAQACCHRYSADEEPAYQALLMGSWNAAQEMLFGDQAQLVKIPYRHRLLQNIRRYESRTYPALKATD